MYRVDLSNFPFNYMCENSPDFLCHFWNHKPFFPTHLLCIFLAQTLHTFDKRSPSERKFSDFPLLLMVLKFSISFSGPRVIFSWNFVSLFSVMRLFCTFLSKHLYAYDKRSPSNWKFSDFRLVARKLTKFLMSVFNPRVSFLLSFASPFSVMTNNSSNIFYPKY